MAKGPVQLTPRVVNGRSSPSEANTMRATVTRSARWCIASAALAAGLLLAACSSSTTSSPSSGASAATTSAAAAPAPSPTSAACQAAAGLRASVATLTHVKIGKGAVNEIKSDLANVDAMLTNLKAELGVESAAQVSAAKSALDTLKTAISNLSAHSSTSTVAGVATAVRGVSAAVGSLLASLPQCGSATASPSP